MSKRARSLLLLSVALSACGGEVPTEEVRARAANTTVWMEGVGAVTGTGDDAVLELRGRASRNLVGAFSYVPDDAFGEAEVRSARTFVVRLRGGHEINSVLSGMPILVRLDAVGGISVQARFTVGLRWAKVRGTSSVRLDTALEPVAVRDAVGLRYRASVRTTTPDLTVGAAGSPTVTRVQGGYTVDLGFADLQGLLTPGARAIFQTRSGSQKTASVETFVDSLQLTDGDPYDVWPAERCTPETYGCVESSAELASCGPYRAVSACVGVDVCQVFTTAPLGLRPIDLSFVWQGAQDRFVAGCSGSGQWCSLSSVEAFMAPECLAAPASVVDIARVVDAQLAGRRLDRAGVLDTPYFGSSYSAGGPAFFSAIDAHFGGGEVQGFISTEEVSCQNCSQFQDVLILWYPAASRVVVVRGGHGYDS